MEAIITAIIITGAIGLSAAVVLTIAAKVMYVEVDPKIALLRDALPGANCGACGFSGCDSYAEALAKGEAEIDQCPPGGADVCKKLGEILGIASDGFDNKIAVVLCRGDGEATSDKMEYVGINTCYAASQLHGGKGSCSFGCLGFGDCTKVCPTDAICIEKGIAHIDIRKCGGCTLCVKACPVGVIAVKSQSHHVEVLCRNIEKGAVVRKKCKHGCIACMKCVRECPAEAIKIEDFLAVIDHEKCESCGHCAEICISKCIALNNPLFAVSASATAQSTSNTSQNASE